MPRDRITYDENVRGHAVFTYKRWFPALSPVGLFWSALGGLSIGIACAVGAAVLGWVDVEPEAGKLAVRHVLLVASVVMTLVLYGAIYWRAARGLALVLEFQVPAQAIWVSGMQAGSRRQRFPLNDVGAFRLVETQVLWRSACNVVMDTNSRGSVTLLLTAQVCRAVPDDVPQFVAQLNERLEMMRYAVRDVYYQSQVMDEIAGDDDGTN